MAALRSLEAAIEEIELESLDDEIDRTALLNEIRTTVHEFKHEKPYERNPARWVQHLFDGLFDGEGDGSETERLDATPEFLALRGREAKSILATDAWYAALEEAELNFLEVMKFGETAEKREQAYHNTHALDEVLLALRSIQSEGEYAEKVIEDRSE